MPRVETTNLLTDDKAALCDGPAALSRSRTLSKSVAWYKAYSGPSFFSNSNKIRSWTKAMKVIRAKDIRGDLRSKRYWMMISSPGMNLWGPVSCHRKPLKKIARLPLPVQFCLPDRSQSMNNSNFSVRYLYFSCQAASAGKAIRRRGSECVGSGCFQQAVSQHLYCGKPSSINLYFESSRWIVVWSVTSWLQPKVP